MECGYWYGANADATSFWMKIAGRTRRYVLQRSCGRCVGWGPQKNTTVVLLAAARILACDDDWEDLREPSLYEVMVDDADDDED